MTNHVNTIEVICPRPTDGESMGLLHWSTIGAN